MKRFLSATALLALSVGGCATTSETASAPPETEADVLPSADLSAYVASVETQAPRGLEDELLNLQVTAVSSDSVYGPAVEAAKARGEEGIDQPIQVANELIVLFRPDLTPAEAADAIADHDLVVIGAMPEIGALVVDCTDALARSAGEALDDGKSLEEAERDPINRLADDLMKDPRFAAVAVNSVMSSTSIISAVQPVVDEEDEDRDVAAASSGAVAAAGESIDWGVSASNIDVVWPLLTNMVTVGVIDVGFADHVDLPLAHGLPDPWSAEDHGNHVTGIMCARHNGVGVRGVLPKCNAKAASGEFLLPNFSRIEGGDAIAFQARFSEYIATVLDFMEANPDAKVINISLGYNWMPNFRIDPRTANNEFIRDLVRSQGRIFQSILAYAKRRDIVIFAAAGNDSTDLRTPLEAEWASPFNFGAKLMKARDGWSNGIVVEAYGQNKKRAKFSNVSGVISCPGVDIKSAIAAPANAYGVMSGTSMASPYCAAAFAALRALAPNVPVQRSVECFLGVSGRIDNRVPRMDLKASFEKCRDSR